MFIYRTTFNLEAEVNDFQEAHDFLLEDEMTKYLKENNHIPSKIRKVVYNIHWELVDINHGYIELQTTAPLSEQDLEYISDWVIGQNSDGLGENFEQQDFASVFEEHRFDFDYSCWEKEYNDAIDEWEKLSEEEKEETSVESYAYDYAGSEPDEGDYYAMACFERDCPYTFEFIEERTDD